jgi:hypothetical protein
MCCGIGADEREDWREHADKTGEADIAPCGGSAKSDHVLQMSDMQKLTASSISERREDLLSIAPLTKDPERNEDSKEAANMQY